MASDSLLKVDSNTDVNDALKRQGSFRRVLPSVPTADSQLSMSAKMIDRPTPSSRGVQKAFSQYQQEYCIISEYNMLRKEELPGIYVIPSAQTSFLWFGVIFVRQGIYQGGVFRFNVHISNTFPEGGCPHVVFQSKIFHPMINFETGEMDVRSGFQEWKKNVNHVWQVVQYVRMAFYEIETKTPLNQDASELYENHEQLFREHVAASVKSSQAHLYDPPATDDAHYISFDPYDMDQHDPIKEEIFEPKETDEEPMSLGLSWVQPGSLQPFSKPNS